MTRTCEEYTRRLSILSIYKYLLKLGVKISVNAGLHSARGDEEGFCLG